MMPGKKTLLQYPGEPLQQRKQPLLGDTPDQSLMITPWLESKSQFPPQELNLPASSSHPSNKKHALLPTPGGGWIQYKDSEEEDSGPMVHPRLLSQSYRSSSQSGFLSDTPLNLYSQHRAFSPLPPMEDDEQPFPSSATSLSLSPGLLHLPGSRIHDGVRSVETRSPAFKNTFLQPAPPKQRDEFASNKKHLLPMELMKVPTIEQTGSGCQPSLLENPSLAPGKKTLLQYPGEPLQQRKQPLLGVTPAQPLMKTPWLGDKRQFPSQDLPSSSSYGSNTSNKRQALLPTPGGEWIQYEETGEDDASPMMQPGLLPRSYRSSTQSGFLSAPSCSRNMYSPPRAYSPLLSMEDDEQPFLSSVTSVSPSPGLLHLPGSRIHDAMRNVETRNLRFKKAPLLPPPLPPPLLQSPPEQRGGEFAYNKEPLHHMVPTKVPSHKQKTFFKAPHQTFNSRVYYKNDRATRVVGNGQRLLREHHPALQSRLSKSSMQHKILSEPNYQDNAMNSQNVKRPLLPTPNFMF